MKKEVFLGGTAGKNNWRESFAYALMVGGVPPHRIYNPVVPEWKPEIHRPREERAKAEDSHLLFYLGDSKIDGLPVSGYSMVEAAMALYDRPGRTILVFDYNGLSGHLLKSLKQMEKTLRSRFPNARIFDRPQDAVDAIATDLRQVIEVDA